MKEAISKLATRLLVGLALTGLPYPLPLLNYGAVKAGGMRVVSKHKTTDKPDSDAYDQKYIDQLPQNS